MKEFIKKWNTDKRFKTSTKLMIYTLFVIIVAIYAISNRNSVPLKEIELQTDNLIEEKGNFKEKIIKLPNEYNYSIKININEKEYKYIGTISSQNETITKQIDELKINYIFENNSYYQEIDGNYILISKEELYDVVNYNFINIENINEYLTKSKKIGNQYLIYLKDMILGNDSDDYIIINLINNKINIDYTVLMKLFDSNINSYIVNIEIDEIE